MREILSFCESRTDWLVETTIALARLESPTTDKAAVDRCGVELESRLRAAGGRVTRLQAARAGDHLRAEFHGGDPQVLLLGHFDTVWPVGQLGRMPLDRRDGRLYGPGVYDMKAGLAIGLLAIRALLDTGRARQRLVLLCTSDEETGSATSRALIEAEARRSVAVLVLEPALAGGAVKTFRKGVGEFEIEVEGIAAHAGVEPDRGASAIDELMAQAATVKAHQDLRRGLSINIGVIEGGSRSNVVAAHARAVVDVRVSGAEDGRRVEQVFRNLKPHDPRTHVTVRGGINRPPFERTAAVASLYELARSSAQALGFDLAEGGTGGASDANFTGALDVPTLDGLGPVGGGAHALDEHVDLGWLPKRAALVAALLSRL